jgi:hypothetical protein
MKPLFFICLYLTALATSAQTNNVLRDTVATKQVLLTTNQSLDDAAVHKDVAYMQTHYAPDFYFLHSTGLIDSKQSWMKGVLDTATHFLSRHHDSVQVELHNDVAVLAGMLTVKRTDGHKISGYGLRYIRVYAYRNNVWQLLSHRSTQEWKLPDESL